MPTAPVNGIELYYEVHGCGPALVFARGAGGNHLSWWQQVPVLSQYFRCITFDHRGFGLSQDLPHGPGADAFVEDLRCLLDHLEIERTGLVAQSMGGWTCLGFASEYPDRVTALVLCDTTAGIDHPLVRREIRAVLQRAYSREFPERDAARCFLYREISGLNLNTPPDLLPKLMTMRHRVEALIQRRVPTLLLVGEDDVLTPPQTMELMAARLPHSRLVKVPNAGHSVYFERPEEFNQLVLDFLREAIRAN
jgi:3-oxoadipate enol-lactonase